MPAATWGRVITGGGPFLAGATVFEKMEALARDHDGLRRLLLNEPRGARHMCPILVVPPSVPDADAGLIIMESMGYPPMSGSNAMCAATVLLETGAIPMREPETALTFDTPAGRVPVTARCRDGRCESVRLENVPAFVTHRNERLDVPGIGPVTVDVAYGGVFYAVVDAVALGFRLAPDELPDLARAGRAITRSAAARLSVAHPDNPAIRDVAFTLFAGPTVAADDGDRTARTAVYQAPDVICRSPTGTGTSARLAILHAAGDIATGDALITESPLGTRFRGEVLGPTRVGDYAAVRTAVEGRAWITGVHQVLVDPDDPFPEGFAYAADAGTGPETLM